MQYLSLRAPAAHSSLRPFRQITEFSQAAQPRPPDCAILNAAELKGRN
jgi:hypothetical protein